jgi:hypothetical protein
VQDPDQNRTQVPPPPMPPMHPPPT